MHGHMSLPSSLVTYSMNKRTDLVKQSVKQLIKELNGQKLRGKKPEMMCLNRIVTCSFQSGIFKVTREWRSIKI